MQINIECDKQLTSALESVKDKRKADKIKATVPFTSKELIKEITRKLNLQPDTKIGVFFTIEWAIYLKHLRHTDVTLLVEVNCPVTKKICSVFKINYVVYKRGTQLKFDVVATNPPFQDEDKNPLYYKFYNTIVTDALKPDGYLAIIAPKPLPVSLESGIIKGSHHIKQREILYVNMSDKLADHFSVGSTFSFTILKNAPKTNNDYDIVAADGKTIKGKVLAFSMFSNPIVNNILDKCFNFNSNPYGGVWNTAGVGAIKDKKGTSKVALRLHEGDKFETYNVRWDRPHKFHGVPKVFVTAFGHRAAVCYDHDLVCASEKLLYTVPTASDVESERLLSIIESNLQKFLYKFAFKRGERVAFLNHFKGVPLTQDWSNEKLYAHFNLTDEEISYIEENI